MVFVGLCKLLYLPHKNILTVRYSQCNDTAPKKICLGVAVRTFSYTSNRDTGHKAKGAKSFFDVFRFRQLRDDGTPLQGELTQGKGA